MKRATAIAGFLWSMLLASCAAYTPVGGKYVAANENFAVELPPQWRQHHLANDQLRGLIQLLEKRRKLSWDLVRITRDGLLLQQICIGRIPIAEELPNTRKKLAEAMIPLEAAEIVVDEFRSNPNLTNQEILENIPASVGGRPGFKLHYAYRAEERLKLEGPFYGALVGPWLYYVLYEAPAQHYFKKDLQVFESTRSSFAFTVK